MNSKKSSPPSPAFSENFKSALNETGMIDAMVQADGWTLAEYEASPPWLKQLYDRHAIAALQEFKKAKDHQQAVEPEKSP